jgi:hypothetical protein
VHKSARLFSRSRGVRIRPPYPKWITRLPWACQWLGFKGETHKSGQSRPEQPKRGTKQHKGWPTAGTSGAPLRGSGILKLRIQVPIGRFPSCPFVWASTEPSVFSARITRERRVKPPGPDLTRGGISPCLVLWRGICPCWLSTLNGDLGSTQILTRHISA